MELEQAKQILNENGYILKEAENLKFSDEIRKLGFKFKEYGHKGLYQIIARKNGKLCEICRYTSFSFPKCKLWQVEMDDNFNGHSTNVVEFNGQNPDEILDAIEYVKDKFNEL